MGYRSEVGIVVAFENWDDMKEVLAVYKMNPLVQKEEVFDHWTAYERPDDVTVDGYCLMEYKAESVKWYDEYADVQAFRHLFLLVEQFGNEREGFKYAYRELQVGEDGAEESDENHTCNKLRSICEDRMWVEPAALNFYNGEDFKEIPLGNSLTEKGEKEKINEQ